MVRVRRSILVQCWPLGFGREDLHVTSFHLEEPVAPGGGRSSRPLTRLNIVSDLPVRSKLESRKMLRILLLSFCCVYCSCLLDCSFALSQEVPATEPESTQQPEAATDTESQDGGNQVAKGTGGTPASFLLQVALFVFLILYGLHATFVIRKQRRLTKDDPEYRMFGRDGSSDAIWTFLLVTCFLPLGITVISVAADSIKPADLMEFASGRGQSMVESSERSSPLNAAFLSWGLAKSVFVLMITLEISYLYNSRSSEWQPMITSALVLDILSFLLFTSLLQEDNRTPSSTTVPTMLLMGLVGGASFLSSFLTILYTRGYEQYYSYKHGLDPPDQMAGAKQLYTEAEINHFVRTAAHAEGKSHQTEARDDASAAEESSE